MPSSWLAACIPQINHMLRLVKKKKKSLFQGHSGSASLWKKHWTKNQGVWIPISAVPMISSVPSFSFTPKMEMWISKVPL